MIKIIFITYGFCYINIQVNSPASIEKVEVQRPGYPTENFDWQGPGNVGQIVGVSVDSEGRPVIFHRGDRTWNYK